ncbi:MAG TPA: CoA pyrophosphatase [Candidatus Limnocylindrales bacterium]|nr:CoA pyrophosphatase [Candidatus Limnocylindrales bacterium]
MERILRAGADWEDAVADALHRADRPIPLDERLLPRDADGEVTRRRFDRATFPTARPASTLLAIYPDDAGRLVIPLTVRHADLRSHGGEVSLPGGAVDAGDADREAAALREAWEEIGLEPEMVRIVGVLDDVWIPVSNFELRPFVGTVGRRPSLVPHDAEVAAIVELPLDALFDDEVLGSEEFSGRGFTVRAGAYRYGGIRVWGATALTLGMLAHVLDTTPA